jgi:hypothetical protein
MGYEQEITEETEDAAISNLRSLYYLLFDFLFEIELGQ